MVPLSLYRKIGVTFIVVAALLFVLVLTVTTSKATVTIGVKITPVQTEFPIIISRTPKGEEITGAMSEVVVTDERAVAVSGEGAAAPAKAHGVVTIKNTTARAQPLVATTRLLTKDGALFRIGKSVVVPGDGEVAVEAAADKPGKDGEIGSSRFTIPGLPQSLQDKIYAESTSAMVGGEVRGGIVGTADVEKAAAEIIAALTASGKAKLASSTVAATYSGVAWKTEVVEETTTPKMGEKATSFRLTIKLRVTGVFYDEGAVRAAAEKIILGRMPPGVMFTGLGEGGVTVRIDSADSKSGASRATAGAVGLTKTEVAAFNIMKARLGGLDRDGIKAVFRDLPGVSSVSVRIRPAWVRRAPGNQDRIKIEVKEE